MNSPKEQDCVLLTLTKDNKIERVRHCTHSDDKLRDYFDAIMGRQTKSTKRIAGKAVQHTENQ